LDWVNITSVGVASGGKGEIPVRRAARHLKVDEPVLDAVARHQLAVDRQKLVVGHGACHVQLAQRPLQPRRMAREIDELAAQHARHLVDAVGEQEAPVEDADLGLFLGQYSPLT
jgi:hypothetical protein